MLLLVMRFLVEVSRIFIVVFEDSFNYLVEESFSYTKKLQSGVCLESVMIFSSMMVIKIP